MLQSLFDRGSKQNSNSTITNIETPPSDLGRIIAPISNPEPIDIHFRNNLPDWKESDFSEIANDAPSDILVHYDITGKSITEGKMGDINACFNDRLAQIRKMIVKNSKLPRKYSEVARLQRESSRYQGYENMAVAIGLVNEPPAILSIYAVPSMYKSLNSFADEPKSILLSVVGIILSPTFEKSAPPALFISVAIEADNAVNAPDISVFRALAFNIVFILVPFKSRLSI